MNYILWRKLETYSKESCEFFPIRDFSSSRFENITQKEELVRKYGSKFDG